MANISKITLPTNDEYDIKDLEARQQISNLRYTISISENVITINGTKGDTSSITLPVYNGGVT